MMDPYLINAVKSLRKGDLEHAVWCAEHGEKILNRWIDFHKKKKSKYQWYDMSVGLRALRIVLLHYIFYFSKGADYGEQYAQVLEEHLDNLSDESKINKGNHGLFQISALKCVAEVLMQHGVEADRESYKGASSLASRLMVDHVKSQFTDNGLHVENSPDYHFFVLSKVRSFLACPWWGELFENQEIRGLLDKAEVLKYWLVDPYGRCLPVGDSSESQRVKIFSDVMWNVDKIAYGGYASFCIDGYYQVRGVDTKKDSFLFFMGGHHSDIHRHDDLQSLIWQEGGDYILRDSGKYGYKSGPERQYFKSSSAHNLITLLDEKGVELRRYKPGNSVVSHGVEDSGWFWMKSEVSYNLSSSCASLLREVWFLPRVGLIVLDVVDLEKKSDVKKVCINWNINDSSKESYGVDLSSISQLSFEDVTMTFNSSVPVESSGIVFGKDSGWSLYSPSYLACIDSSRFYAVIEPVSESFKIISGFSRSKLSESDSAKFDKMFENLKKYLG